MNNKVNKNISEPRLVINPYEDILDIISELKEAENDKFINTFNELADISIDKSENNPIHLLVSIISKFKGYNYRYDKNNYYTRNDIDVILSNKDSYKIMYKFIVYFILGDHWEYYSVHIIDFIQDLNFDFSSLCMIAIFNDLSNCKRNREIIFNIAIDGKNINYDRIIEIIIRYIRDIKKRLQNDQEYNKATQMEIDFNSASAKMEEYGEEINEFNSYLEKIVMNRRNKEGYKWIIDSSLFPDLIEAWIISIKNDDKISVKEIKDIISIKSLSLYNKILLCDVLRKINFNDFRDSNVLLEFLIKGLIETSNGRGLTKFLETVYCFYNANEMKEIFIELKKTNSFRKRLLIYYANNNIENYLENNYLEPVEKYMLSIDNILSKDELELSKILINEELGTIKFCEEQINKIRTLIYEEKGEFAKDILASIAVVALSQINENIESIASYILEESDEYEVKSNILYAISKKRSDYFDKLKIKALTDKDYRCRKKAILLLANEDSIKHMHHVIHMCNDNSAPIRKICAELIGEKKYIEGLEALSKLLKDNYNIGAGGDTQYFSNNINYPVARKAAQAFVNFNVIPNDILEYIIKFIKYGEQICEDIVVHYELINSISDQKNESIIILFKELLENNWIMKGVWNDKSYPIRYAAMWGILKQILNCDVIINESLIKCIYNRVFDKDGRIAGPSLIILGVVNEQLTLRLEEIFNSGKVSSDRKLLLYGVLMLENPTKCNTINLDIYNDLPLKQLLDYCIDKDIIKKVDFEYFLNSNLSIKYWLEDIEGVGDVNFSIRFVLNQIFESKGFELFENIDFRENDLAKNMQILNDYNMFIRDN